MTRVDPSDQLAALMRAQLATLRKGTAARKPGATPAKPAARADLATLAAERVRAIAPDDPEREQKAVRVFLECVVLSELGTQLVNDPAFVRMIDHVQQQLQADPKLAAATAQAAQALLKTA